MDQFFSFSSRNKSVLSFKIRPRTGKTKDFSSRGYKTEVFPLQSNPSNLDPSYKMDLYCWDCFTKQSQQSRSILQDGSIL